MAKRGTPEHPKLLALADRMGWEPWMAVGLLECLWHWCSKYAVTGVIDYPAQTIARGVYYTGDADGLIEALIETGWLERFPNGDLYVHDVADHADNTWRAALNRRGMRFATPPSHDAVVTQSLHNHNAVTTPSSHHHDAVVTQSQRRDDGVNIQDVTLDSHGVNIQDVTLDSHGVNIQSDIQDFAYQTKPNQTKPTPKARVRARKAHALGKTSSSAAPSGAIAGLRSTEETVRYLRSEAEKKRVSGDLSGAQWLEEEANRLTSGRPAAAVSADAPDDA
jgi:hypothetical protein